MYNCPQEDFPKKPKTFLKYLEHVLGEFGFAIVKKSIIDELRTNFKIREVNLDIDRAIKFAQEKYLLEDFNPEEEPSSRTPLCRYV